MSPHLPRYPALAACRLQRFASRYLASHVPRENSARPEARRENLEFSLSFYLLFDPKILTIKLEFVDELKLLSV